MGTHRFVIEGTEYEVQVGQRAGSSVRVSVNGKSYDVEVEDAAPPAGAAAEARPAAIPAPPASRSLAAAAPAASRGGQMRAPISGVVLRVEVEVGQRVTRGTVLLILEAMKMENEIFAAEDGVVQSLDVKPLQEVREGDLLLVVTPG